MTNEEFFQRFGYLAEAPDGIPRIRRLILDLAVRGCLVPQDPNDEPAAVLIERMSKGLDKLVEEKVIRAKPRLPVVDSTEAEFATPLGWEWIRLGAVSQLINGDRGKNYPSKADRVSSGVPFINAGHLVDGSVDMRQMDFISEDRFELLKSGKVRNGDILFCLRGSLGKTAQIRNLESGAIASSLLIIRPMEEMSSDFLHLALLSPMTRRSTKAYTTGSAQPNLSARNVARFPTPLPPVREQERIVEKVEELMGICDALEEAHHESVRLREATARSSLSAIVESDRSDTKQALRIIRDHLRLSLKPGDEAAQAVVELRKTIFTLAMKGRLINGQDSKGDAASELIERCHREREELREDGQIRGESPTIGLERPTESLPPDYCWSWLGEICALQPRVHSEADDAEAQFLPMEAIPTDWDEGADPEIRVWSEIRKGYSHFRSGDILLAKITPCFQNRKSTIAPTAEATFGAGTTELFVLRPLGGVIPKWVLLVVKSELFIRGGISRMTGTAGQQRVPRAYVAEFPIPLPPLDKQAEIVEAAEHLLQLCDELEKALIGERQVASELAESTVASLVSQAA